MSPTLFAISMFCFLVVGFFLGGFVSCFVFASDRFKQLHREVMKDAKEKLEELEDKP